MCSLPETVQSNDTTAASPMRSPYVLFTLKVFCVLEYSCKKVARASFQATLGRNFTYMRDSSFVD